VGIIVVCSVVVLDVGVEGLVADGASSVSDLVLRVDQVTTGKTGVRGKVFGVVGGLTLEVGALAERGA